MRTEPRSAAPIPPIDTIREAVRPIAEEYEARLVILFGSLARGDERPGDLDLAVRGDAPLPLVDLTNELIRALQYQQVDLTDLMVADPVLLMMVARDGIPLYEATPGAFAHFHSLAARRFADTAKFRAVERARIRQFIRDRKAGS